MSTKSDSWESSCFTWSKWVLFLNVHMKSKLSFIWYFSAFVPCPSFFFFQLNLWSFLSPVSIWRVHMLTSALSHWCSDETSASQCSTSDGTFIFLSSPHFCDTEDSQVLRCLCTVSIAAETAVPLQLCWHFVCSTKIVGFFSHFFLFFAGVGDI